MSTANSTLTHRRLLDELEYDQETGVFRNRIDRSSRSRRGAIAGSLVTVNDRKTYLTIGFCGRNFYAHRLAIFYVTGRWPTHQVDHVDGNPLNNRYANLRETSNSENQHNRKTAQRNSTTGVIGVYRRSRPPVPGRKQFFSHIRVDGKRISLGCFYTIEEASAAYLAAKRKMHPGNLL